MPTVYQTFNDWPEFQEYLAYNFRQHTPGSWVSMNGEVTITYESEVVTLTSYAGIKMPMKFPIRERLFWKKVRYLEALW